MPVDRKKLSALVDSQSQKTKGKPPTGKAFGEKKGGPKQKDNGTVPFGQGGGKKGKPGGDQDQDQNPEDKDRKIAQGQAQRIENGNGDDRLHDLAGDVDMGDADGDERPMPPDWAVDTDVWDRAVAACNSLSDVEDMAAVVVHTYQALGGEIAGGDQDNPPGKKDDDDSDDDYGDDDSDG